MYFAINIPMSTLSAKIVHEFKEMRAAHVGLPMHLFALVDCAFDEEFLDYRYPLTFPPQSLYDNTVLQQFGTAAPHLLKSPADDEESLAWLTYLFSRCGNKPMLSIIASPVTADELGRHMRPYLIARTPDTVEWPVRWGDTRVLPVLLGTLTESQRVHFLGPVGRWWSPARDGGLLRWDGARRMPADAAFDKLPLSDEAFGSLVDAAEADAVLAQIEDTQPDVLRRMGPCECHDTVRRHLILASANGIDSAGARRHFSVMALVLREGFSEHPEIAQLLQQTRAGADYGTQMGLLSPEFWLATATS